MSDVAPERDVSFSATTGVVPIEAKPVTVQADLEIDGLCDLKLLEADASTVTYRARQKSTGRAVAVHVLLGEVESPGGRAFDRERIRAGLLSGHSGVVPLFETGTTIDGRPYLVRAHYERGTLADLIAEHGPLAWREATFLLEPVAVTMAEVHSCGLVHRSLQPQSIRLTDFLLPRVADFSRSLADGELSTSETVVTPDRYLAPESTKVGPAEQTADVYGLAATLWALLAGRAPRAGARFIAPRAETPGPIVDLLRRSMSDDPSDRPVNAAAFVTELRRSVSQADTITPQPNASQDQANRTPAEDSALAPTDQRLEKLYVLLLVGTIATGVLAMVAAAVLAVN